MGTQGCAGKAAPRRLGGMPRIRSALSAQVFAEAISDTFVLNFVNGAADHLDLGLALRAKCR